MKRSEVMYWPHYYRRIPYYLMRDYRGFDEGFFDGGGCGPGGDCGPGPGPGVGDGFGWGGIGSFIVGGLAGAFLASAFGSKNAQAAAQPAVAQPVVQPLPVATPMPYGYAPYGYNGAQAAQMQNQQGQKQIITSSTQDEDEELYPEFDEWIKQKQPIKETHSVYTIPSQPVYGQQAVYQIPMTPYQGALYQGAPYQGAPYQGASYQGAPYQLVQQGVASYPMPVGGRPMTTAMPYYMFPVQQ